MSSCIKVIVRAPLKQKQNKNLLFSSQNGLYGRPLKVTAESALWESLRPLLPPHGEPPELQQNSRTTSTPTNKNGTRLRYSRFSEHETMKHSMEPSTLFCLAQTKRVVNLGGGGISARHEIKARLSLSFVADCGARTVRRRTAGEARVFLFWLAIEETVWIFYVTRRSLNQL